MAKQMEGDNKERRKLAKEARDRGKLPSEIGGTLGASKQRAEASDGASHQNKIDLKRQGKQGTLTENSPEARPGNRDPDSLDQERHPRL
jgi:hypothetical protein